MPVRQVPAAPEDRARHPADQREYVAGSRVGHGVWDTVEVLSEHTRRPGPSTVRGGGERGKMVELIGWESRHERCALGGGGNETAVVREARRRHERPAGATPVQDQELPEAARELVEVTHLEYGPSPVRGRERPLEGNLDFGRQTWLGGARRGAPLRAAGCEHNHEGPERAGPRRPPPQAALSRHRTAHDTSRRCRNSPTRSPAKDDLIGAVPVPGSAFRISRTRPF